MKAIFTLLIVTLFSLGGVARNIATDSSPSNQLASFTATINKNTGKVDVKWTSASETNLNYFMLERSTDGINFKDAGMIFANGNTSSASDYIFPDQITQLNANQVYYRLRSVNNAGDQVHSEIRVIRIEKQAKSAVTIDAKLNQVTGKLQVTLPLAWKQKSASIEVFNAQGQLVKVYETAPGIQPDAIDTNDLRPGKLFIVVTCGGATAKQIITKQ